MKTIKEVVDELMSTPTTPDAKIFMIAASAAEDYFNCLTNVSDPKELFMFLYNIYKQSPVFKEALDLVRAQADTDNAREISTVKGAPANSNFTSTAANEAIKKAIEELGGIYTGIPNDIKS